MSDFTIPRTLFAKAGINATATCVVPGWDWGGIGVGFLKGSGVSDFTISWTLFAKAGNSATATCVVPGWDWCGIGVGLGWDFYTGSGVSDFTIPRTLFGDELGRPRSTSETRLPRRPLANYGLPVN